MFTVIVYVKLVPVHEPNLGVIVYVTSADAAVKLVNCCETVD